MVTGLGFLANDGSKFVSGALGGARTLKVWEVRAAGKFVERSHADAGDVESLEVSPDLQHVLTTSYSPVALAADAMPASSLWDPKLKHVTDVAVARGSYDSVTAHFSPDGQKIVIARRASPLEIYDLNTHELARLGFTSENPQFFPNAVFAPLGKILIGLPKSIALFDPESNSIEREFAIGPPFERYFRSEHGQHPIARSLSFSPDGKYILTDNTKGEVLLNVESGDTIRQFEGFVPSIFEKGSTGFITIARYPAMHSLTQSSNATTAVVKTVRPVDALSISADGRFLFVGGNNNTLWDLKNGTVIDLDIPEGSSIVDADFSAADNSLLLVGKRILVYDPTNQRPVN
jgi:WD40 repeat protein